MTWQNYLRHGKNGSPTLANGKDRVGFDREWLGDFDLSILFDWDRAGDVIEFGDYAGRTKWSEHCKFLTKTSVTH